MFFLVFAVLSIAVFLYAFRALGSAEEVERELLAYQQDEERREEEQET